MCSRRHAAPASRGGWWRPPRRWPLRTAISQLFYWAGVDNPRAIGFANNFGFRVTGYRRQARNNDLDLGDDEVALVFSLMNDDSAVPPNPTSRKPAPREGPLR